MCDRDAFFDFMEEVREKAGEAYSFKGVIEAWQKQYRVESAVNYCKILQMDMNDSTVIIKLQAR